MENVKEGSCDIGGDAIFVYRQRDRHTVSILVILDWNTSYKCVSGTHKKQQHKTVNINVQTSWHKITLDGLTCWHAIKINQWIQFDDRWSLISVPEQENNLLVHLKIS